VFSFSCRFTSAQTFVHHLPNNKRADIEAASSKQPPRLRLNNRVSIMSLLHGDFLLFPCSASNQGAEEFLVDGVFCFYTRIPIDIVFKLLKDFEEVWIKMATVSSRDILKMFAQCRSELEVGPSGLIALNLFHEKGRIPSHEKRYTVTVRFANLIAHTADLATVYHLLIQPEFHSATLTDLAKEHPIHADSINRLTPSEVVTLLVGFPEPRIKRAVGMFSAS